LEPNRLEVNLKSDVNAKAAYCALLRKRGYVDVKVCSRPADIVAFKGSERHHFEIKFTRRLKHYFGAATLTEWEAAVLNPHRYTFVVAYKLNGAWNFDEYSVEEFMAISSIPPFKIFFRASVPKAAPVVVRKKSRQVAVTLARLQILVKLYGELRESFAEPR